MLPFESKVADYIKSSGNHVMYRVTPVFEGNNLLCTGVQIEAYSVEDKGKTVSFNVFCYNVQPGVILNYADGTNSKDKNYVLKNKQVKVQKEVKTTTEAPVAVGKKATETASGASSSYIANKNTKKFHYPSCSSVSDMKEKNKLYFDGSRDELIGQGYVPCKRCNP
jgi:DNA-entry nuclease